MPDSSLIREQTASKRARGAVRVVVSMPSIRIRTAKWSANGSMWMSEARRVTASAKMALTKSMTGVSCAISLRRWVPAGWAAAASARAPWAISSSSAAICAWRASRSSTDPPSCESRSASAGSSGLTAAQKSRASGPSPARHAIAWRCAHQAAGERISASSAATCAVVGVSADASSVRPSSSPSTAIRSASEMAPSRISSWPSRPPASDCRASASASSRSVTRRRLRNSSPSR